VVGLTKEGATDQSPPLKRRVLRTNNVHAAIRVAVIRKWDYRGVSGNDPIQHVDMVFVDEHVRFLLMIRLHIFLL
jgi:hypothetical protein